MHIADRDNHPVPHVIRRRFSIFFKRETLRQPRIMPMNPEENSDHNRCEDQHNPCAISEFCNGKHEHHDGCAECAESIAEHLDEPAFFISQIMGMHAYSIFRVEAARTPPATLKILYACMPKICDMKK